MNANKNIKHEGMFRYVNLVVRDGDVLTVVLILIQI